MGKGIANPIAAIWPAACCRFPGGDRSRRLIMKAIKATVLQGKTLTPDLGGQATPHR